MPDSLRILVTGDRNWSDAELIGSCLAAYVGQAEVVIHGAARGADRLAGEQAELLGFEVQAFPADWDRYRPANPNRKNPAGVIRNRQMLYDGKPNLILAFHDRIAESRGTADMIQAAQKMGIKGWLISHEKVVPI